MKTYVWAMSQIFVAISHVNRQSGNRAENLDQAIHHYHQALEVFTRQAYPKEWASAQNDLGEAYRYRSLVGERAKNLEQAIFHYEQALEIFSRQAYPEQWAASQNNLGICQGSPHRERLRLTTS